jgi:hypothetical protein
MDLDALIFCDGGPKVGTTEFTSFAGELKLVEENLETFLGLGVAGRHDFAAIGAR